LKALGEDLNSLTGRHVSLQSPLKTRDASHIFHYLNLFLFGLIKKGTDHLRVLWVYVIHLVCLV